MEQSNNINNQFSNFDLDNTNKTNKKSVNPKQKKGLNKFWTIFISQFCGFVACLILVVGIGAVLYFNVTPNWLNKKFNTKVNLVEEINDMPISEIVGKTINILTNTNEYTFEDLKNDFNIDIIKQIKEKSNIDLTEVKNVAISTLSDKLDEIHLSSLLGYKVSDDVVFEDKNNNNVYDITTDKLITGIEAVAAKQQIKDLKTKLENLKLKDVFTESERVGLLKLIDADIVVSDLSNQIANVISNTKLGVLVENGILTVDNYNSTKKFNFGNGEELISNKTIPEIISFFYEN